MITTGHLFLEDIFNFHFLKKVEWKKFVSDWNSRKRLDDSFCQVSLCYFSYRVYLSLTNWQRFLEDNLLEKQQQEKWVKRISGGVFLLFKHIYLHEMYLKKSKRVQFETVTHFFLVCIQENLGCLMNFKQPLWCR